MKRGYLKVLLPVFLAIGFTACEKKVDTGVSPVHWDRDMCSRCVMVVSDRKNTVQVKNPQNGKTYMFDDIGCMVLWFDDEKVKWRDKAIIWITDVDTGKFIDARKAYYDTNNITPMSYGFSAHEDKNKIKDGEEIISFEEVVKRVRKIGQ